MSQRSHNLWLDAWYGKRTWTFVLLPLMWLFRLIAILRRFYLCRFAQQTLSVPVIVVGNISVGGTGKTPLLTALVKHLQRQGFTPGVVSRGYGGRATRYPLLLSTDTRVEESGDEPLSIFQQTGCAVCVDADRVRGVRELERIGCNIVLSDDGLQHYRLGRAVEIIVVDGQRGLGNGYCLPVGPLREPGSRLCSADFVVVNSAVHSLALPVAKTYAMQIIPQTWHALADDQTYPAEHFPECISEKKRVNAVAGIGNPRRFYQTLMDVGLHPVEHDFPDHHAYQKSDFAFTEQLPVVMTAKDAVKCQRFAEADWFYLAVGAELSDCFWHDFDVKMTALMVAIKP